jgi:hypothetical protein
MTAMPGRTWFVVALTAGMMVARRRTHIRDRRNPRAGRGVSAPMMTAVTLAEL